jgi:hypothetical protein
VCARIAVGVCYPSRISALRPVLRAIGLRVKKALGLRSQQVAIAPHKHMPIATYINEYIELAAGRLVVNIQISVKYSIANAVCRFVPAD